MNSLSKVLIIFRKFDFFLLIHFPKIWKSKIHWTIILSIIAFITTLLFADLLDAEPQTEDVSNINYESIDIIIFGIIPMIIWAIYILYWLYSQYKSELTLNNYSFLEITSNSMLNFASITIPVIPVGLLILITVDNTDNSEGLILLLGLGIILILIPISFLPFVIRHFRLIDLIASIIVAGLPFSLSLTISLFIWETSSKINAMKYPPIPLVLNYVIIAAYVFRKYKRQAHTQFINSLAFLIILITPWIVSSPLLFKLGYLSNLKQDIYIYKFLFFTSTIVISLLIFITWIIAKSVQQPNN